MAAKTKKQTPAREKMRAESRIRGAKRKALRIAANEERARINAEAIANGQPTPAQLRKAERRAKKAAVNNTS